MRGFRRGRVVVFDREHATPRVALSRDKRGMKRVCPRERVVAYLQLTDAVQRDW